MAMGLCRGQSFFERVDLIMSDVTVLPAITNPCWRKLATGNANGPWSLLALKILLTRIRTDLGRDASEANIEKCTKEIRGFFEKNLKVAKADLHKILN